MNNDGIPNWNKIEAHYKGLAPTHKTDTSIATIDFDNWKIRTTTDFIKVQHILATFSQFHLSSCVAICWYIDIAPEPLGKDVLSIGPLILHPQCKISLHHVDLPT